MTVPSTQIAIPEDFIRDKTFEPCPGSIVPGETTDGPVSRATNPRSSPRPARRHRRIETAARGTVNLKQQQASHSR